MPFCFPGDDTHSKIQLNPCSKPSDGKHCSTLITSHQPLAFASGLEAFDSKPLAKREAKKCQRGVRC
jgi:hypothetical protein